MVAKTLKKPRADGQMSGLAGGFFVAAELLERGLQTSLTFGKGFQDPEFPGIHPTQLEHYRNNWGVFDA